MKNARTPPLSPPGSGSHLLIGQVARQSGVPIKTIRFYEELGLLPVSGRTDGGFRVFSAEVLSRLAFIKRAQGLGMSLNEIREFLDIRDQGSLPCGAIRERLEAHIQAIDTRLEELQSLKQNLVGLLSNWQDIPPLTEQTICPNLQC